MKAQRTGRYIWGLALAGGLAASGLAQEPVKPSPSSGAPETAAPSPPAQVTPGSPSPQAPLTQLSQPSLEIQKLTQAGVAEAVILAYITNSTSRYSLTPEAIIQLHGTGASQSIITAMIAHDKALSPAPPPMISAALPAEAVAVTEAEGSTIVATDDEWPTSSIIVEDEGYAPEQPTNLGPVRAPYPVRLNDPIVIMKLPSFTIPYW